MHPARSRWLSLLPAFVLFLAGHLVAAEIQVGAASVSLTPPAGIGMAGYYHERAQDGSLDGLQAKAMVLDDGATWAAVVVCDLISMPAWIATEARRLIGERTSLPGSNVLIAATHTHTAPVLYREWSRDSFDGGDQPVSRDYSRSLPGRIAEAVALALERRQPARLSAARGHEPDLARNRRFWMRDGTVAWNPGKGNTNIVRPAGPIDPEVGLLWAESLGPKPTPLLAFVNYAMHPDTTGGTKLSADYPGVLARHLALCRGTNLVTVFANGTCGNLNHIDVRSTMPQGGPGEAARLGTILSAAVLKALPSLQPLPATGPLRVSREVVRLPPAPFTPAELEQARLDVRIVRDNTKGGFMKLVRAYRILDTAAREGRPFEVEVQVIALGRDAAWVSWPGEIFVELGLEVKKRSPFAHTYNVELANTAIGYIPNRSAYAEGAYEVESARVAEGSGELLVESALRQLHALARTATPAAP
jgi:hypothetical protein